MADEAAQKAAIKKQVEYYFNDANFRRDKHLRGIADADPQGCECLHHPSSSVCRREQNPHAQALATPPRAFATRGAKRTACLSHNASLHSSLQMLMCLPCSPSTA